MADFLTEEWLADFVELLNSDERYAQVAKNWEADMLFVVEPGDKLAEQKQVYLDLWHGKCREAYFLDSSEPQKEAVFTLRGPYQHVLRILKGEIDPMQAMLTGKLKVTGNMSYLLRNVPVVLDFVRCLRQSTEID